MQPLNDKPFASKEGRLPYWPRYILWTVAGVAGTAVFHGVAAPWWLWGFGLLVWGGVGAWLRPLTGGPRQSEWVDVSLAPPTELPEAVWSTWLDGWYWQTNGQHRLVALKSGQTVDDVVDWASLTGLLAEQPLLWDCWADDQEAKAALAQLQHGLVSGMGWSGPLRLPVSGRLGCLFGATNSAGFCELQASTFRNARGDLVGFHGVLRLVPSTSSVLATSQQPACAAVSETEQEALRYALSHDLRAPLRVVDGFTRIIKEDYGRFLDRMGHDHLDRVLAASARMNGMIDAILGQAQLAGMAISRERVDLTSLAREISADLVPVLSGTSLATVQVSDGLVAQADPQLLRRIMENLIGNALKYSAKVPSPRVDVGSMPATNPVVYFVRDNGAGFDMKHAEKLFGLFQRLHSAKDFPGTGVGLAGVQNIIRRHGGQVWAEAKLGEGACFYFTLTDKD